MTANLEIVSKSKDPLKYLAIYLQTFPFFRRLSVPQIEEFFADQSFEMLEVKYNTMLFTSYVEEDEQDPVYLLLNGKVAMK